MSITAGNFSSTAAQRGAGNCRMMLAPPHRSQLRDTPLFHESLIKTQLRFSDFVTREWIESQKPGARQ
jgi:hypothetical protein